MTVSINASADGTYGELQVNGVPQLRFGADTSGQLNDFRNRIINGAMAIDQRFVGTATTPTASGYVIDRWFTGLSQASKLQFQQNLGAVALASDIVNYFGAKTVVAQVLGAGDVFNIQQRVEGFNFADAKFGTVDAKPVTLSFRVHSNLTGTHSGALSNATQNRSYPFNFSVPVADTWTTVSITIPGDTTGTWVGSTNGIGAIVVFSLGAGTTFSGPAGAWAGADYRAATGAVSVVSTLNATFNLAKVQLEVGSIASAFERRSYGVELGLCQRYFYKTFPQNVIPAQATGSALGALTVSTNAASTFGGSLQFPVTMRAGPGALITFNPISANANWRDANNAADRTVVGTGSADSGAFITGSAGVANGINQIHLTANSEL